MTEFLSKELSFTGQKNAPLAPGLAAHFPERFKAAQNLLPCLDVSEAQAVLTFGLQQQRQHLALSEATVQHLQAGRTLALHQALAALKALLLALEVGRCHCQEQRPWALLLCHVPLLGSWLAAQLHSGQALIRRFVHSRGRLAQCLQQLDGYAALLLQQSAFWEGLEQQQREQVHQLEVLIVAGELKLAVMEEDFFLHQETLAAQNGVDAKELQDWHNFGACIQAVDARLHTLKQSHAAAKTFAPALQGAQGAARQLAARLQESLALFSLWKGQMLLFIAHLDPSLARRLAEAEGLSLGEKTGGLQETLARLRHITRDLLHSLEQGREMGQRQGEEQNKVMEGLLAALGSLQGAYQYASKALETLRPESA
jgi:hypothetical protein